MTNDERLFENNLMPKLIKDYQRTGEQRSFIMKRRSQVNEKMINFKQYLSCFAILRRQTLLCQNVFVRPVSFAKHHKEMRVSLLLPFPHFNRAVPLLVPFIFTNANYVIKE